MPGTDFKVSTGITPGEIATAIGNIAGKVGELVTNAEERATLRMQLYALHASTTATLQQLRVQLAEHQASVIIAEANGQSWLQRNWRPMLMLAFGAVVLYNYALRDLLLWLFTMLQSFGVKHVPLPPTLDLPGGLWSLLQIGVGGYIGGRTIEKVAGAVDWSGVREASAGMFDKRRKQSKTAKPTRAERRALRGAERDDDIDDMSATE